MGAKTQKLFGAFAKAGTNELDALLAAVASPYEKREPRHWNITEVAGMLGRSVPWLRKHDPDCPTDDRGRRRYSLPRINELRRSLGILYRKPDSLPAMIASVMNFKGGVGKSTLTIHIAHYAAIQGWRVLVVDLDPQATSTSNLLNIIPEKIEYEGVATEYLLDGPTLFKRIIQKSYFDGVDVAPTNLYLQDLDLLLPNDNENNRATLGSPLTRLEAALEPVRHQYDLILIDCAPNMGSTTGNAIYASQGLVVPLPPSGPDASSFVMLTTSLESFYKSISRELSLLRVLINKHSGTSSAQLQEGRIRKIYGSHVLRNTIFNSAEVEKAATRLSSIFHQEKAIDSRDTYLRAIDCMSGACEEILDDVRTHYEKELRHES